MPLENNFPRIYEPERQDKLNTLLTPGRDIWAVLVISEIDDILVDRVATLREKREKLFELVLREQASAVAEER